MATASAILSIVKTHPISLKENLLSICAVLNIETDQKETKVSLQTKIDDASKLNEDNDKKIREKVNEIKTMHKER